MLVAWKGARDARRGAAGARGGRAGRPGPVERARASSRSRARATGICTSSARSRPRPSGSRGGPGWRASARSPEARRGSAPNVGQTPFPTGPDRSFEPVWAPFSRSRTRRAGSARRPPPSTSAHRRGRRLPDAARGPRPAVQRHGCAWAAEGRRPRTSTTASSGELTLAERRASRAASSDLDVVPSTPDLAGANVELPRIAGSESVLREPPRRRSASATCSRCSTARRRSARSRSTRSWRPTR